MRRRLMKSKVHRATITSADLHYEGSLTLDRELMDAANLVEYEEIHVVNVNNGQRFVTYIIPGEAGSGTVQLNGAAARLGMAGDLVILIAYADVEAGDVATHVPHLVFVDHANRIVSASPREDR
ncbi:MAG TPA: aspartate 1-decarboxylase [Gemmatimonadales bacterium]|nr:aspartate 1-decarboxylase [Gemmatimonadales bacterium]